jgi:hypothetical protein
MDKEESYPKQPIEDRFWYRIKKDNSAEEAFCHLISILSSEGPPGIGEVIMGRGFKRLFRDPQKTCREFADDWVESSNPISSIGCLWDGDGWCFFGWM